MAFSIIVRVSSECSEDEFYAFEKLVIDGGEVNSAGLQNRIKNAYFLAWALDDTGEMIGVAALKRPSKDYRATVFRKSQTKEEAKRYEKELGWIFVRKEFRRKGLATKLVDELLGAETPKSIYATARELNDPMLPLLKNFGFVQSGGQYSSTEGDYDLVLYIKSV